MPTARGHNSSLAPPHSSSESTTVAHPSTVKTWTWRTEQQFKIHSSHVVNALKQPMERDTRRTRGCLEGERTVTATRASRQSCIGVYLLISDPRSPRDKSALPTQHSTLSVAAFPPQSLSDRTSPSELLSYSASVALPVSRTHSHASSQASSSQTPIQTQVAEHFAQPALADS